jgi:bifunctional enzyme CysN/CysC
MINLSMCFQGKSSIMLKNKHKNKENIMHTEHNLTRQNTDITRSFREAQLGQKACTIWFTGLSGSGKSELANALEKLLVQKGRHTMLLDGDNVRMGLNNNLGFSEEDRIENIRRIAEVCRLMNDAGLIVLAAFISPFARDRRHAREIIGDSFAEVYVSTPLEECARRDVKGLYARAKVGEIPDFTGISSPYEVPEFPEAIIDTTTRSIDENASLLLNKLKGYLL